MELIGAGPGALAGAAPAPPAPEVSAVATPPDTIAYPPDVLASSRRLAQECSPCYQCGTCTSTLPQRPRALPRAAAAGPADPGRRDGRRAQERRPLALHRVRHLHRRLPHGHRRRRRPARPAPRSSASTATPSAAPSAPPPTSPPTRLRRRPRIDNLRFGAAMVAKGHVPKDKVGAAGMGMKLARQMVPGGRKRPAAAGTAPAAAGAPSTLPFYAGCALPQDHELHALVHEVAAGLRRPPRRGGGRRLLRPPEPRRRRHAVHGRRTPSTRRARPATPASRRPASHAVPLWDALTERARRARPRPCGPRRPRSSPTSAASPTATRPWPRSATPPSRPAAPWSSTTRRCTAAAAAPSAACTAAPPRRARMLLEFAAQQQRARRHHLLALPRQPALRRARAQARRPRPLLARVLPGRPDRPGGPYR